ncbi:MAG: hypothetical protein IPI44_01395 [Sulfuritalea sp.]|nr:hypothetical protein [Sulfuritalea sp.]
MAKPQILPFRGPEDTDPIAYFGIWSGARDRNRQRQGGSVLKNGGEEDLLGMRTDDWMCWGCRNWLWQAPKAHFAMLRLGCKFNQAGTSQGDELFSLTSQGITALTLSRIGDICCKDCAMKIIHLLDRLALTLLAALSFAGCEASERSPYPVMESELTVPDGQPASQIRNFRWLDNDRVIALVVDRIDVLPKGYSKVFQSLKIWNVASNTVTTLAESDVGGLCVGEGFIRYYVKRTGKNGKEVLDRYFGPVGQVKQVALSGPLDSLTCKLKSEVRLPEWALAIPDLNIRRLRPEHGFLVIDRDSVDQAPRALRFYRPGNARDQVADLSNLLGDPPARYPSIWPRYFEYRAAYLLAAIARGQPELWLFPDGRLEPALSRDKVDMKLTRMGSTYSFHTKAGVLFGASSFSDDKVRNGGLFFFDERLRPQRVVKGRIGQEIEVSPDGCKAAFGNDTRERVDGYLMHKLQVINICEENKK